MLPTRRRLEPEGCCVKITSNATTTLIAAIVEQQQSKQFRRRATIDANDFVNDVGAIYDDPIYPCRLSQMRAGSRLPWDLFGKTIWAACRSLMNLSRLRRRCM